MVNLRGLGKQRRHDGDDERQLHALPYGIPAGVLARRMAVGLGRRRTGQRIGPIGILVRHFLHFGTGVAVSHTPISDGILP